MEMSDKDAPEVKDFFISYNKADRAWAEWIAQQLEHEGYSTIIQAWDFAPGHNFVLKMHEGLQMSRRTLLVLSPSYLTAVYPQPEWTASFMRDPQGKEGRLVPVRVRDCQPDGLLAPLAYIDLVGITDEVVARKQLIDGLQPRVRPSQMQRFPGAFSVAHPPNFPGIWPLFWNVPYRRNPFFTDRKALLDVLHERLTSSTSTSPTQAQAIHGLGGIGKTQTAVEYAYLYRKEYQAIFWVRATASDTLISDFVTLAGLLQLTEREERDQNRVVEAVKRWLAQQQDWLLILDDADDLELVSIFLPITETGHVLLTTRDQGVSLLAQSQEVEKMDLAEGALLLLRRSTVLTLNDALARASSEAKELAETIVTLMDGLPLAIEQAGAYIAQTGCGLARYLNLYKQYRTDLLRWRRRIPSDYPKTVASTWALSFEQVEARNPSAADLLRLCAFLDPDAIAEDLVLQGASELSPVLQKTAADGFRFDEALDVLRSFSLIRRLPDSKSFAVHRLVQVVLKEQMDTPTQQQWAQRAVRVVEAAFPEVEFETWPRCKLYLPHALMCADLVELYGLVFPEAADLLHRAGVYLQERAQYGPAEALLQHALSMREQTLGPEHPDTSITLDHLAGLYRTQGLYEQAEPLYQRALAIREQTLGPEHPDTSVTLNNLAVLYRNQGQYSKAEPLYQRALAISELTLGPNHPETAATLNNLAGLYWYQGQYEKAEPLYQRARDICEQTLGLDHPQTAAALNNLAELYWARGQYEKAEPLYQRARDICEQTLGPDHPHTAVTLFNLARVAQVQKRYESAEELFLRALAIDEQTFGQDHLEVVEDLETYATLLRRMNREDEAALLETRAKVIRSKYRP